MNTKTPVFQQLIRIAIRSILALFICVLISSAFLISGCKSQATHTQTNITTDFEEHYQSQGVDIQAEIDRANREWREQHGDTPPNITDAQQAEAERYTALRQQQLEQQE